MLRGQTLWKIAAWIPNFEDHTNLFAQAVLKISPSACASRLHKYPANGGRLVDNNGKARQTNQLEDERAEILPKRA